MLIDWSWHLMVCDKCIGTRSILRENCGELYGKSGERGISGQYAVGGGRCVHA